MSLLTTMYAFLQTHPMRAGIFWVNHKAALGLNTKRLPNGFCSFAHHQTDACVTFRKYDGSLASRPFFPFFFPASWKWKTPKPLDLGKTKSFMLNEVWQASDCEFVVSWPTHGFAPRACEWISDLGHGLKSTCMSESTEELLKYPDPSVLASCMG